jgi:predicted RNase H-like nuclease (RuvC/YqgF family)
VIYDLLRWISENWEPLAVFLGLVVGTSSGIVAALLIISRGPLAKGIRGQSEALEHSSHALVASNEAQLATAQALTEHIQANLALETKVNALEDTLAALRREYSASCDTMGRQISGLQAKVKTQEQEIRRLNTASVEKDGKIAELQEALRGEQQKIILLNERIDALVDENKNLKAERETLQQAVADLKAKTNGLPDTGKLPPLEEPPDARAQQQAEPPATRELPAAPGEAPEGAGEGR